MSRKSDCGRQRIAYAIDVYGLQRTPCEKKRFVKSVKLKRLQKLARKKNRK